MITGDFETRGVVDLTKFGATRYATDTLTQVLCFCWTYDDDEEVHLWHREHRNPDGSKWCEKSPRPDELIERIRAGELFEAHNAKFEFLIWNNVLTREDEFPEFDVKLQVEQMRCSAAKASCLSLRRKLGDAANDIGLTERKDPDGQRLINKLSKPTRRRSTVSAAGTPFKTQLCNELYGSGVTSISLAELNDMARAVLETLPPEAHPVSPYDNARDLLQNRETKKGLWTRDAPGHYTRTDMPSPKPRKVVIRPVVERDPNAPEYVWCDEQIEHERNWNYCKQDVRTERNLSNWCDEQTAPNPCMTQRELDFWFMDFRMNLRGIKLDRKAAEQAIDLCSLEVGRLDAEMQRLTDGRVEGGSKRIPFRKWANEKLVEMGAKQIPDTKADTLSFRLFGVPTKAAEEAKAARKDEMEAEWLGFGDKGAQVKRAFEICLEVNRSSVAKFRQMMGSVAPDGRLHDIMLYNGADRPVSGDAEILTRQGWRRIDEWHGGEIAQWAHQKYGSGEITFAPARRAVFSYNGDMVRMVGPSTELLCTVDHKIPLISCRDNLTDTAAGDVRECNWAIPLAGNYRGATEPLEHTRLIVMYQADGRTPEVDKPLSLHFRKQRKIARCKALLRAASLKFDERIDGDGSTNIKIVAAPDWLRQSKEFGSWLLNHDPAAFIAELEHWDGTTDKRNTFPGTSYSTCSKNNAEWVQTMAALAGTRGHIEDRGIRDKNWRRSYRVHVHNSGARSWLKKNWTFKREPSPGKVYCARTQTGYFLVRYNGAIQVTGNTGRWSGQGVQPHNFVRGYQENMGLSTPVDKDRPELGMKPSVWDTLLTLDLDYITLIEGPALPALAKACRGALTASDGCELYAADFKAIEARKLAWMANCLSQLALFRSGGDPYLAMAMAIYNRELTKKDKTERQLGKKAVLGLGYAMGWEKFQATVWMEEGIWLDDAFCKKVVHIYRKVTCPEMPILWKAIENAAILATQNPGKEFSAGGDPLTGDGSVSYFTHGRFLHCRLPSGRLLAYLDPEVHTKVNYRFSAMNERDTRCIVMFPARMGVPMNRVVRHAEQKAERERKKLTSDPPESFTSPHLSFMGRHIITKEWKRLGTHGGPLTENADQASSRDLLADAMWRVDQDERFNLLLSIHDEVISEGPIGCCTVPEFEALVSETSAWAATMPVEAEGWVGPRLRK